MQCEPSGSSNRTAAARLCAALDDLVDGAHRAGQLRTDFTSADIPLLLEHLTTRIPVTAEHAATPHQRYLDLALTGLLTPTATTPTTLPATLPGPARPGSTLGGAQRDVERA
ncbi:hypothetical protein [Streptomyces sp. NPDC000618]|uniref:hypothetical protein n=1 Tax=Streptomyces sp. NPDC000618 TaxID=3154265 RepID=UPI003329C3AB